MPLLTIYSLPPADPEAVTRMAWTFGRRCPRAPVLPEQHLGVFVPAMPGCYVHGDHLATVPTVDDPPPSYLASAGPDDHLPSGNAFVARVAYAVGRACPFRRENCGSLPLDADRRTCGATCHWAGGADFSL